MPESIASLFDDDEFARRHIGPTDVDVDTMLSTLGLDSLDELLGETMPPAIRSSGSSDVRGDVADDGVREVEAIARLRELAGRNEVVTSLIGMGYHGTITPPVIARNVLENPAWYTAYTPYQPEIS
ncbi:MAG: glycine dehydrogenase (aminomethyl-transferring), partial [Acidimicrobiia bacterium]|nr:glycine dehydrogenase (aminomethyl-transferring) [Acidimicrobiia bacterium]